jgi:hypothetical protein
LLMSNMARSSRAVFLSPMWDEGWRTVTKALLLPIHALQFLSQLKDSAKSIGHSVESGQVWNWGKVKEILKRRSGVLTTMSISCGM